MFDIREGWTDQRGSRKCFLTDRMELGGVEIDDRLAWTDGFQIAGLPRDMALGERLGSLILH